MPKRRMTRNPPAKKPEVEQNFSPEELKRREGIDLMLKDFDKQVEGRISEMKADMESVIKSIHTLYKVELIKLPSSTKNMKWDDYVSECREDGSYPITLSNAMDKVVEDITSVVDPKVSLMKSTMKTATKRGKAKKSEKFDTGGGARKSSRTSRSSKVLADFSNMATPATSSRSTRNPKTPGGPGMLPPDVGHTPFITPRFNTATPFSRTVSRVARPNETLVSLTGSPVVPLQLRSKAAKAEASNNALIPLGNGQTLNVPMGQEGDLEGFELDDDAREKLAAIHASLGNMLKIRDKNSQSSVTSDEN